MRIKLRDAKSNIKKDDTFDPTRREREDQARESRGQKEDLYAILAKLHLKNK